MKLTTEEKEQIAKAVKARYVKAIEDAVLERVLHDNSERIQKHCEEISSAMTADIRALFPL